MPNFDRTGPRGAGAGTGRRMGPCANCPGCGRKFFTKEEEKEMLENEIKGMEKDIDAAKKHLSELED